MRSFHYPGRSVVMGVNGMVATSHPMATQAGLDVLKQGGNALDAAVAASAVQCVTEPFATGIGGDCFLLYHDSRSGQLFGLNGSGRAPAGATPEAYRSRGLNEVPERGILAVTVPGAVHAWESAIHRFGSKGLDELFAPAIQFAAQGYAVSPVVGSVWREHETLLAQHNDGGGPLLVNGAAPRVGSVHYQPELAESLRIIATQGAAAFYSGPLAEAIVNHSRARGGLLELDDFAAHQSTWVEPLSTTYGGIEVFEVPPNSQGLTALLMLNIMAQEPLGTLAPLSPEHLHRLIESYKLALAERDAFVTDMDFSAPPLKRLLAADYAAQLHARIDPHAALAEPVRSRLAQGRDTVYISVVDRERNAASFINSLYYPFGSMEVAGDTGIVLQNRGRGFSLDTAHCNCIAPGKRPMHTIMPAMAYRGGELVLCFGVMGGSYQAMGHSYVLSNCLDFDLDIQAAIDAPRFLPDNGTVWVEQGVPQAVRQALARLGHKVAVSEAALGGAQAVYIDPQTGVLHGGSDGRKDGCAIGY